MKKTIRQSYRERLNSAINNLRNGYKVSRLTDLAAFGLGNTTQRAFVVLNFLVWDVPSKSYAFTDKGLSNTKIINQVREWQRIQMSIYNKPKTQSAPIKFHKRKATQVSLWSKLVKKVKSIFE